MTDASQGTDGTGQRMHDMSAARANRFITDDDVRLHHIAVGDGAQQIVFLHGWCCSATYWWPVMALLPKERFSMHAIDIRGFGNSEAGRDGNDTYERVIADVRELVDSLAPEGVVLAGHSLGGSLALAFIQAHRDRVSSLVLVGTGAAGPEGDVDRRLLGTLENSDWSSFDDAFWSGVVSSWFDRISQEDLRLLVREARKARRNAALSFLRQALTADLRADLGRISVPTLLIHGVHDQCRELREAVYLSDHIAGSELLVVERSGHTPLWERPDRVGRAIDDFLSRHGNA